MSAHCCSGEQARRRAAAPTKEGSTMNHPASPRRFTTGLSQQDWSLHRKGSTDQARHNEKVKEAIRQNLPDIISEQSIITSDGKKIVKVPIRSLEEYKFRFGESPEGGQVGQGQGGSQVGDVV